MPIDFKDSRVKKKDEEIIPAQYLEMIDITGKIIIDVDNHSVQFEYSGFEFVRNDSNEIETDAEGKIKARRIYQKKLTIGDMHFSEAMISPVDGTFQQVIEDQLVAWIKENDSEVPETTEFLDATEYVIVAE